MIRNTAMICFTLLLFSQSGISHAIQADELAVQSLVQETERLLKDDLQTVDAVIPNYKPPTLKVLGLLVADFNDESGDPSVDWGKVLGQMVRFHLTHVPQDSLRIPSYRTYYLDAKVRGVDDHDIGRSIESVKHAGASIDTSMALTGSVSVTADRFELKFTIINLKDGAIVDSFSYVGQRTELAKTLGIASRAIYQTLVTSVEYTANSYLVNGIGFTESEFTDVINAINELNVTDNRRKQHNIIKPLWNGGLRHPLITYFYLSSIPNPQDSEEVRLTNKSMLGILADSPNNRAVRFLVGEAMIAAPGYGNSLEEKLRIQKRYVLHYPNDVNGYVNLATTLSSNGKTLDALVVSGQAVKNWPDDYRTLWNYSWALNNHAWKLRGSGYWSQITPRAKKLFPKLRSMANRLSQKALAINNQAIGLWVHHINTMDGYSKELMDAFHEAIKIDPHHEPIYSMTINYAQPKWHGSESEVEHIWRTAIKHNPKAGWPYILRDKYSPGSVKGRLSWKELYGLVNCKDDCPEYIKRGIDAGIGIFAIIVIYSLWRTILRKRKDEIVGNQHLGQDYEEDPIEKVEVMLAYGRKEQAIKYLNELLDRETDYEFREDIKDKIIEITRS